MSVGVLDGRIIVQGGAIVTTPQECGCCEPPPQLDCPTGQQCTCPFDCIRVNLGTITGQDPQGQPFSISGWVEMANVSGFNCSWVTQPESRRQIDPPTTGATAQMACSVDQHFGCTHPSGSFWNIQIQFTNPTFLAFYSRPLGQAAECPPINSAVWPPCGVDFPGQGFPLDPLPPAILSPCGVPLAVGARGLLSLEEVERICPPCAERMRQRGITAIRPEALL